ncbi:Hexokinase-3 [Apostasia shenzhenica]|uniref:Phosphotransferase n=1 Tax=Apostasia shenzhenica TaxID=1088818 RepID=A0A2I0BGS8_9ASPA|nr:Hexokinase-3 [Apostasia shenzhenica]
MGRVGFIVALGCAVVSCAIATVFVGRRVRSRRRWGRAVEVLREFEEGCSPSVGRLRQVVDAMAVEMNAGLASDGGSKLKMLLTFIDRLPDGTEAGTYYALDLGGTNFRLLRVQLGGIQSLILSHEVKSQPIPQHLMTGKAEDLFDFIATALKAFVDEVDEEFEDKTDVRMQLGFTFSFHVRQTSVSSGILIRWTNGFSVEDAVGKDVTQLLERAMRRSGLNMRVAALVNDTVGLLALGHYHDGDTVAAVVIGTGTNACYIERTEAIIKSQGLLTNSGFMVVNIEWGNFWSAHLPRTAYDTALDEDSPNPNDQGFEKMISGMYLGEIVRRVLYRIAQESDIFENSAHCLAVPFILRTPLMAAMHEDDSPDLREVGRILQENLDMPEVPLKGKKVVVRVCDIVTRRAAKLVAAGIVGILKKMGRDGSDGIGNSRSVISMEGGLFASYKLFREYLNEGVVEILGEEAAQYLVLRGFEDGSGLGAALLAACFPIL